MQEKVTTSLHAMRILIKTLKKILMTLIVAKHKLRRLM